MSLHRPPAARDALSRYQPLGTATRTHVAIRWLTCPFAAVEAAVPSSGRVLELGCGHGLFALFAALSSPSRSVTGVDIDADKIAIAAAAAEGVANLEVAAVGPGWVPDGSWDAIVIIDVLYLLGAERGGALVDACAAALAPGGRLVIKEIEVAPRWKHGLAVAQELVATRVTRITQGDTVAFLRPSDIAARLVAAGLVVEGAAIDHGYPHPHHLLVATRPAS